ncbi:MAG: hypothetical protein JSU63_00015 [Phycisphaerales bacterium]|nr:MAG: hypothetical protein JSU63_00015 [Phycisphaerales bacterium]
MARISKKEKKEFEKFFIREFLHHLGYSLSNVKWQERPDALLTVSKGKTCKKIAVEHTYYFNDTVAGKVSPLTPIDEFWRDVQASLVRRISHRKHLTGISASVCLRKNLKKPSDPAALPRDLAEQLVAFFESCQIGKPHHYRFSRDDFAEFPVVYSLIEFILAWRETDGPRPASRWRWQCFNTSTGTVGLNLRYITTAIESKNQKGETYENWGNATEKWLLITASGLTVGNIIGSPMDDASWGDPQLRQVCEDSPFDRIVLWERSDSWYKWLKPNRAPVQYSTLRHKAF